MIKVFQNKKLGVALLLLVLFAISVIVRVPYLNRPLCFNHEWLTSTVLRTEQIWFEDGAIKYLFNPIMTYNHKADRYIRNQGNQMDDQGNYYYISYPPFAYIFPYIFFKLLNVYPDVLPIQIFGIFIHFISAILIFMLIRKITRNDDNNTYWPAIVGFCVYTFSPATLWYHSNVYMSDMLVQPFFIGGIYSIINILTQDNLNNKRGLYPLGVVCFFMVYTEWISIFFIITVFAYLLFFQRDASKKKPILKTITIAGFSAIILTIWQYSNINGFFSLIKNFISIYIFRSGYAANSDWNYGILSHSSWIRVADFYYKGYGTFLLSLIVIGLIVHAISSARNKASNQITKTQNAALFLAIVPVILHHLIFFNFTAVHGFSVLKTAVFFSLLVSLLIQKIAEIETTKVIFKPRTVPVLLSVLLIVIITITCIYQYKDNYRNANNMYRYVGTTIMNNSYQYEMVFTNFKTSPQVVFYSHRNLAEWKGKKAAQAQLIKANVDSGVLFFFDQARNKLVVIRFSPSD